VEKQGMHRKLWVGNLRQDQNVDERLILKYVLEQGSRNMLTIMSQAR
jgi:hypothetical protein